jgi:hypothetical protein
MNAKTNQNHLDATESKISCFPARLFAETWLPGHESRE